MKLFIILALPVLPYVKHPQPRVWLGEPPKFKVACPTPRPIK